MARTTTWIKTVEGARWHACPECPDYPQTTSVTQHVGSRPPARSEFELGLACFWCLKRIAGFGDSPTNDSMNQSADAPMM